MKRKFMLPFRAITVLLMLGLFTIQIAQAQENVNYRLPNGTMSTINENGDADITAGVLGSDNFILGSSGFLSGNGLVLNGTLLSNLNSGWFDSSGSHSQTNDNYICGELNDIFYRNFFAFDLSQSNLAANGIVLPITSAVLQVMQAESAPPTGIQEWKLSKVTTAYSVINQNYSSGSASGIAIFEDFGMGTFYGSIDVDKTLPFTNIISVTLSSAAVTDINAAVGSTFVIGGEADDLAPPPVPVSNWAILFGVLLIGTFIVVRYRTSLA